MVSTVQRAVWKLAVIVNAVSATYTLPADAVALDPAPVGVSLEFFTFPSYFTNVSSTFQCLRNFKDLTGLWPPIRIGGTTQDRATYDPKTSAYVVYTVPTSTAAPASLTFGSSFMDLAATYNGTVVMGLNRGHDNIDNTIAAAQVVKSKMSNLLAIELGNEPEYWVGDKQPIALTAKGWSPYIDAESQDDWDIRVGSALHTRRIIQAGNSNSAPPSWGAAELIATENATAKDYVHDYAHHNYPGGTLQNLMSHKNIASNIGMYKADVAAAIGAGKEYVFGETNSVSGGGAASVSPTFGAALWTMDYILRASLAQISRSYFHHGTLGACYYCWWGRHSMGAPYWGAYLATAAMAGGSHISAVDVGNTNYATYIIYDAQKKPLRAVLYNSDYYDGSAARGSHTFTLDGLASGKVLAKRLTAASALSRVDQGSSPTFGGQGFENGSCAINGTETFEGTTVVSGVATFQVKASEALLVYL